ncbi:class I SAM-dependent methyltransferase [Streptomyces xanthophaeus]
MTHTSGFQLADSSPGRYERHVAPVMVPFVEALVEAVDLVAGSSVLDLACGTGFVARCAALQVGPGGRIEGVDLNEGMLAAAAACLRKVRPEIVWRQASADALPFGDGVFDAVACQQGAQYFPDLEAALGEAARVTRAGRRVGATVWAPLDRSPYFEAQASAIGEIAGAEAAASYADAFACSAERLAQAFRTAGLRKVEAREVVIAIRLPDLADFAAGFLSALPWGQSLAEADPDGLALAGRSICRVLGDRMEADGSVTVPFTSTLVTAVR